MPENYLQSNLFREISQRIEERDALLACGLSYATIKYYFGYYYGLRNEIRAFPAEISRHPGWRNIPDFKRRMTELRAEADETVRNLLRKAPQGKVWLFTKFRQDEEISSLLENRLLENYVVQNKLSVKGSFYSEIWELVARNKDQNL